MGAAVAKYFGDPAVAALVRKSYPDFPPEIVCAWIYWTDPGSIYYPEAANRQFEPQPPGTGLEISKITPARTPGSGLFIEGDVTNISEAPQKVPQLRVALQDATAREVQVKIVDAPKAQLLPGEAEHFSTAFSHPSDAATGVVVTFAPDGDR
ncbi:MAG TPA: FxLYD domain-containing protein [Stellaceae bacterium]|nr:FxLYD domain-containing protein [Stellaceae bacterium]